MKTHAKTLKKNRLKYLSVMVSALVLSYTLSGGNVRTQAMSGMNMTPDPGGTPDYFGTIPNFANSPLPELDANGNVVPGTGLRKFVDSLPGLGAANANDLGQYIPVAVPDKTTYPGSDYYEIALIQYTEQLHKDLPATTIRGYMQVNTTDSTVKRPSYLGPAIIAQKDRPVRVKFTNKLPTGSGGDLFLPVDTTAMGAGTGPKMGTETYTQNRATLHLHGGITPWISDGNPHQWITPAGENTSYPTGVSVQNVPDMPDPGPGSETFFYTNQQSARLMFYHDHTYGITRLNVYAGEAAPYLIQDQVEQSMIASGAIPSDQIPLIIQDKTFVPKDHQLTMEDPTWNKAKWGSFGNLWFPHVYMPNQNPYNTTGSNVMGRYDYGPWFWPPYTGLNNGPVTNPLYPTVADEPPVNPGTPNVSLVPEAFMDTPLVNGTAYPYLDVQPKAYRFRILNASNDRAWNLQLYTSKSNNPMWASDGTLLDANAGEVQMVPAVAVQGYPDTWPTDGRAGGVPDPAASGPKMVQIGTESGFLPSPVELTNQPIDYSTDRRDITVLNVTSKTLLLGPAERADVVIDFSKYAGKTLILYNDAPAPIPAYDTRYDYYTGDPDQTDSGGAPTTLPGYGPNTRTVMQIRVASPSSAPAGTGIASITSTNKGTGYTAPVVTINDGGGTGAAANVLGSIDNISVTNPGDGYTSAPAVDLTGGSAGKPGIAKATISVSKVDVTDPGKGYTSAPTVNITDVGAVAMAKAKATLSLSSLSIVKPGSGYTTAPTVTVTDSNGGTGSGAAASATLSVSGITVLSRGYGYASVPTVTIADSAGGTGTGASATATISGGRVIAINITSPGSGYTAPVATVTGGGGTGAVLKVTGSMDAVKLTAPGSGYTSPVVALSGGTPVNAAEVAATGSVDAITLTAPGVGYNNPIVNLQGGGAAVPATAKASGVVDNIKVLTAGLGYTTPPTVTLTGGGAATAATAAAALKFTDFVVTSSGSGYTSDPTVTITDSAGGSGTGAAAVANLITATTPLSSVLPTAFTESQHPLIVPSGTYVRIQDTSLTFTPVGESKPVTMPLQPKAIQELFETDYGRMNATMGMELPNTNVSIQTTIPYGYVDPVTEKITDLTPNAQDGVQIWKITHNGVDTHFIHFHLFDVQVINRVGWDGTIRQPDPNELGIKDTVRMNPLEDCIVALRPVLPKTDFGVPDSIRPLDVTMPLGSTGQFMNIDPMTGNPVTVTNKMYNFGWEYTWHCHILGHEENDMMRPIEVDVPHTKPTSSQLVSARSGKLINLSWSDPTPAGGPTTLGNPANEIGFRIERATVANGKAGPYKQIGTALANATTYVDATASQSAVYSYRVVSYNATGTALSNAVTVPAN